jgi:hypothetical protein
LKDILEIKAHRDDHVCPSVIPTACLTELDLHCKNFEGIRYGIYAEGDNQKMRKS